ncbi:MAG: transglutaminaseTgpA domain-containing protein [Candidatus Kaelpia aquatica]|nr:transglutaminaseTgpA domain-containing protein [Candidatus Kaelpia aquatica]
MFYIISFLLVSIGIAALPLIEGVGSSLLLAGSIFTFGFVLTQLIKIFHFSKNIARALLFIASIVGAGAFFTSGNSGEWAIVWLVWYFILSFQIISIFSSKDAKSWFSSYLLSFIQLSLGGIFTEKLFFLVIFSLYLALSVFGFIFLLPKLQIREKILKLIKPRLDLARWGALTTVNVFFVTGLVFLVLPRTQDPLFAVKKEMHLVERLKKEVDFTEEMTKEEAMSLPDEVELGTISELKNENKILMLVETEKPFLFKAQTFNYYNGSNWIKYGSKPVAIRVKDEKINFKPLYLRKELFAKMTPDKFYHQKFYIRNYSQNLILGSYPIISLSGSGIEEIKIDHFENIYLQRKLKFGDEYEVVSVDKSYPSNYLRSLSRQYPKEIMDLYLQLPPDLDKRLMDLTSEILKYTPPNIYDELITIRKYLKEHCVYSRLTGKSPTLYEFLFDKKPGDCEYFATALALMLRYRNIPTRLIVGFSGGEFDSQKRTSIVYAKNAHAWIEVFFPTIGWLPCDATPKALPQEQWEEEPKVLVLKPQKSSEDKGSTGESSIESGSGEIAYSKQSSESERITEEGVPEEDLLPEDYYFKDKLSQYSLPKEEAVFSGEFFEEAAPAEDSLDSGSELEEEVSPEELAVEEREAVTFEEEAVSSESLLDKNSVSEEIFAKEETEDWFYKEDSVSEEGAAGEGVAEEEPQLEKDVFEEIIFSGEEEDLAEELEESMAKDIVSTEEDLLSFAQGEDKAEFTGLESEIEKEESIVEEDKLALDAEGLEEAVLTEELKEEQDGEGSTEADSLKEITDEISNEGFAEEQEEKMDSLSESEEASDKEFLEEGLSIEVDDVEELEDRSTSLVQSFEEDKTGDVFEVKPEEDSSGIEEESTGSPSVEEEISEPEDISEELLSSSESGISEEDLLADEGLVVEDSAPLEEEMLPSQEIQVENLIAEEDVLSESYLLPKDTLAAEEKEEISGSADSEDREEEIISDLEIIDEGSLFEEGVISEEMPAEDVFLEEDISLEEVRDVLFDEKLASEELPEELEEEVFEKDVVFEPDLKSLKEEPLDDVVEIIEDKLMSEGIEGKIEDYLVENILFDDDFEKLIADQSLTEVEDVIEDDFEIEELSAEDMIPDDDLTSGEMSLLFKILKDKLKEWVFGFSYYTQALIVDFIKGIFGGIKDFLYGVGANIYNHLKNNRNPYALSFVTIIVVYLLWTFLKELIRKKKEKQQVRRLFPQKKLTKEEKKVRNFYFQVLDLLAKAGYKRLPNLTPREFSHQIISKGFSISKDFYHLTDMFYRISFGQIELEVQELRKVDLITASIREWTKETRR